MGCLFCAIIARTSPADVVLDDDSCVAFLDHRPLFPGHVLVVPRRHRATLADLEPHEVNALFSSVQAFARAIEKAVGADGSFVAMNNGVSQSVAHAHVHVVPRRRGDGLRGFFWPRRRYAGGEASDMAARIRAALA